jgi:hypothetical protein
MRIKEFTPSSKHPLASWVWTQTHRLNNNNFKGNSELLKEASNMLRIDLVGSLLNLKMPANYRISRIHFLDKLAGLKVNNSNKINWEI